MKTIVVGGVLLTAFAAAACNKGPTLEQIRKDGYQCSRDGQSGGFVAQAGNHCFSCADDTSMSKCGSNPLTSGCKEVACAKK